MINRTPRRPPRILPSLRGRSPDGSSSSPVVSCAPPVVKPKPSIGGSFSVSSSPRGECEEMPPDLKKLVKCLTKIHREQPLLFKFIYGFCRFIDFLE
jgi:hypothetical protein